MIEWQWDNHNYSIAVAKIDCYFVTMTSVVLTLFGEEYIPQPAKAVKKSIKKKTSLAEQKEKKLSRKPTLKKKLVEASRILNGWQPEKQYYSIGEVAGLFQTNTSHIRFWTKEFNIKVRTTKKGDRLYTPGQIYEMHTIYNLVKERGFTLAGAKIKLKEEKRKGVEATNLRQSLLRLKNQLTAIRKQLD